MTSPWQSRRSFCTLTSAKKPLVCRFGLLGSYVTASQPSTSLVGSARSATHRASSVLPSPSTVPPRARAPMATGVNRVPNFVPGGCGTFAEDTERATWKMEPVSAISGGKENWPLTQPPVINRVGTFRRHSLSPVPGVLTVGEAKTVQ